MEILQGGESPARKLSLVVQRGGSFVEQISPRVSPPSSPPPLSVPSPLPLPLASPQSLVITEITEQDVQEGRSVSQILLNEEKNRNKRKG